MRYFDLVYLRRSDRGVGRAVDGKFKIPGSSFAAALFLLLFIFRICGRQKNPPHLRKAKLFLPKKAPLFFFFFEKSLHKLQIR